MKPIADLVACEVLEAMGSLYHQHTTQCLAHRRYSTHASSLGGKKGTPRSCRLFIRFPGMAGLSLSLLFSRAYMSWTLHTQKLRSQQTAWAHSFESLGVALKPGLGRHYHVVPLRRRKKDAAWLMAGFSVGSASVASSFESLFSHDVLQPTELGQEER